MRVRFTTRALDEIDQIAEGIELGRPGAGEDFRVMLDLAIRRLADFPLSGRIGRIAHTRELVVARTPYVVAYRTEMDHVDILAVWHGARRWPRRFLL